MVASSFSSNLFANTEFPNVTDEFKVSDSHTIVDHLLTSEMAGDFCFSNCSGGGIAAPFLVMAALLFADATNGKATGLTIY